MEINKNQVLAIHHDNWLKQDISQYHLNELNKLRIHYLDSAAKNSENFAVDDVQKREIILSKLIKANTIKEIIEYVKTNQYPS